MEMFSETRECKAILQLLLARRITTIAGHIIASFLRKKYKVLVGCRDGMVHMVDLRKRAIARSWDLGAIEGPRGAWVISEGLSWKSRYIGTSDGLFFTFDLVSEDMTRVFEVGCSILSISRIWGQVAVTTEQGYVTFVWEPSVHSTDGGVVQHRIQVGNGPGYAEVWRSLAVRVDRGRGAEVLFLGADHMYRMTSENHRSVEVWFRDPQLCGVYCMSACGSENVVIGCSAGAFICSVDNRHLYACFHRGVGGGSVWSIARYNERWCVGFCGESVTFLSSAVSTTLLPTVITTPTRVLYAHNFGWSANEVLMGDGIAVIGASNGSVHVFDVGTTGRTFEVNCHGRAPRREWEGNGYWQGGRDWTYGHKDVWSVSFL